jgi:hypothetical protein
MAAATATASAAAAAAAAAASSAAAAAPAATTTMPGRATTMPRPGGGAGILGVGPGQEIVNEGGVASRGLGRLFGELADDSVGDPGLAGEGNPFLGGQDAVYSPELQARGQDATQGSRGAVGLFSAGRGLGQRLIGVAARVGGCAVAEQVVVGAAAGGEGHRVVMVEGRDLISDRLGDRGHLRDPSVELRAELTVQQAAHVLALGHAVGDALAVEFVDDLLQPEVDVDRFRAKRGTARAVV